MDAVRRRSRSLLRSALSRLHRLDYDGDERNFLLMAPLLQRSFPAYRLAVITLDRALELEESALAHYLKAKSLIALGQYPQARLALERSLHLRPRDARSLAARAECALLTGDSASARRDLDVALEQDPGYVWGHYFSGACALGRGEVTRAVHDLERALALRPRSAACQVLLGLAHASSGNKHEAGALLDAAAERAPWAQAFRAVARANQGDSGGAESDLREALAAGPQPWMFSMRAGLRERGGFMAEAVADMDEAVRLEPESAAHRARRAHLHFRRRDHRKALADLRQALRLEPDDPGLWSQRAEVYFLIGRLPETARDLERAGRLRPTDASIFWRLAQVRILEGRGGQVRRELDRAEGLSGRDGPALRAYWGAYAALRRRRFQAAARGFGVAAALAERAGSGLSRKFEFYRIVAASLGATRGRPVPSRKDAPLKLCGLGLFPPYTASLEATLAVSRCDVVFNNVAGLETAEFLWALAARVVPATFDGMNDAPRWADRIFAPLTQGRVVGFATRGHAQVFGGLAWEILSRCRRRKIACQSFGAVSSVDAISVALGDLPGEPRSFQAYDAAAVEAGAGIDPAVPLLLYFYLGAGADSVREVVRRLLGNYPKDCPVRVFGPQYDRAPVSIPLRQLPDFPGLHSSHIVYIPGIQKERSSSGSGPCAAAASREPAAASGFLRAACAAALLALSLGVGARAQGTIEVVGTQPSVEAGALLDSLAGSPAAYTFDSLPTIEYTRAAHVWFEGMRGHPAVRREAALDAAGFSAERRGHVLLDLTAPPELAEAFPVPRHFVEEAGGRARYRQWLRGLQGFARDSRFDLFLDSADYSFEPFVEEFRVAVASVDYIGKIERYTGMPFEGTYRMVLSPFYPTRTVVNNDEPLESGGYLIETVFGCGASASGRFSCVRPGLPIVVWHELGHGTFDVLADLYGRQIDARLPAFAPISGNCYGSWKQCFKEHVARAIMLRLVAHDLGEAEAERALRSEGERRFPYLRAMTRALAEDYETDRRRYPTLADFYPRLIACAVPGTARIAADPIMLPDPDSGLRWIVSRAQGLQARSERERAERILDGLLQRRPSGAFYLRRAEMRFLLGRYGPAQEDAARALGWGASAGESHFLMGLSMQASGESSAARKEFQRTLRVCGSMRTPSDATLCGDAASRLRRDRRSGLDARKTEPAGPMAVPPGLDAEALRRDAVDAFGRGRPAAAKAYLDAALATTPDDPESLMDRGVVLEALYRPQDAASDYTGAIAAFESEGLPGDGELLANAYSSRASLRQQNGDAKGALSDLENALRVAPPDWNRRVETELREGDARRSVEAGG